MNGISRSSLPSTCQIHNEFAIYWEWQIWVTKNVGELLAHTFNLIELPRRDDVARSLSICIAQTTEGNITEFAGSLGFLKSAVSQWRSGKALPQLAVLLKMCRALNVSLLDFLLNPESFGHIKLLTANFSSFKPEPQQLKHQFEMVSIQQALQAVLEEETPPTMNAVAQRLGYSARSIRRRFPALCSAISVRYLNYRDKTRMAKVEKCCQEVRQIAIMLHNKGIEHDCNHVTPYLKKPAYFRDSTVAAALDAVRQELGLD